MEDKLLEARNRAAQADALIKNELIQEAFKVLEDAYIGFWRSTKPEDEKGREKLYLAINVVGKVKDHLQSVLNDGKIADAELKRLIDEQERRKFFGLAKV